jgi:hypothetical protein
MGLLGKSSILKDLQQNNKNDKLTDKRSLLGAFGLAKYDAFFGTTFSPVLPSYPPIPEPPTPTPPIPTDGPYSNAFSSAYEGGAGSPSNSSFSSAFSNAF